MIKIKAWGTECRYHSWGGVGWGCACLSGKNNKHRLPLILSFPTQNVQWSHTALQSPHFLMELPTAPLPSGLNPPNLLTSHCLHTVRSPVTSTQLMPAPRVSYPESTQSTLSAPSLASQDPPSPCSSQKHHVMRPPTTRHKNK